MQSKITELYRLRFNKEIQQRNAIWKVLCADFFQRYVKGTDSVCDIGAGYCEFINNIKAKTKFAVDINPETKKHAKKGVKTLIISSLKLSKYLKGNVDVAFCSNFFEHLESKEILVETIVEIQKTLKRNGILIVLMPNIRYVGSAYWDFLDHQLPLTEKSMVEALTLNGFEINQKRNRFLPYSTKGSLPSHPFFVKLYLRIALMHLIFGKQSLIIAKKISK